MEMLPKLEEDMKDCHGMNCIVTKEKQKVSSIIDGEICCKHDTEYNTQSNDDMYKCTKYNEDDSENLPLYHTPPNDGMSEPDSYVTASKDSPRREVSSCKTIDLQQSDKNNNTIFCIFEDSSDADLPVVDLDDEYEDKNLSFVEKVSLPATPNEISQKSQHVRPVEKTYAVKNKRTCLNSRNNKSGDNDDKGLFKIIGTSDTEPLTSQIVSPYLNKNKIKGVIENDKNYFIENADGSKLNDLMQTPPNEIKKQSIRGVKSSPQRASPLSTPKSLVKRKSQIPKTPSSTPARKKNQKGETPLHRVCKTGNTEKLGELLEEEDVDVNVQDNFGWTPLHEACIHKHHECVKLLLEHGAEVNVQANNNDTPLHDACAKDSADIVKLLLDFGACKTLKNNEGLAPIHFASSSIVLDHLELATDSRNLSISGQLDPVEDYNIESPVIAYSCVSGQEMARLQKVCLTFKTERDVSKHITHLVCEVDENMVCRRTIKFLKAMALGIPIVSKLWMEESHKASKWVPISNHMVLQSPENREGAPKESFVQHFMGIPGLFTGLAFFVDSTSNSSLVLNRGLVSELIEHSGGKLMKRMPRGGSNEKTLSRVYHAIDNSLFHSHPFIYISEGDQENVPDGFIMKNPTWVLNCIANFKLEPYDFAVNTSKLQEKFES